MKRVFHFLAIIFAIVAVFHAITDSERAVEILTLAVVYGIWGELQ